MTTPHDQLGESIDSLDNLAHALAMPLPAAIHLTQLRSALPELVAKMKAEFKAVTGEDPWA